MITAFTFWLSGWRMSEGFIRMDRLKKEMFIPLRLAKRHFGYQADERLKPKCPFGALRSPASPLGEMGHKKQILKEGIENEGI
jgi:hypothetical protein